MDSFKIKIEHGLFAVKIDVEVDGLKRDPVYLHNEMFCIIEYNKPGGVKIDNNY